MNPLRKQLVIDKICEISGMKVLPETLYKNSYNQLLEFKELVEKSYNRGREDGVASKSGVATINR